MAKKLGSCIEKARPYYEALENYQKAQKECQSAATQYQRASGIHAAAKGTIHVYILKSRSAPSIAENIIHRKWFRAAKIMCRIWPVHRVTG